MNIDKGPSWDAHAAASKDGERSRAIENKKRFEAALESAETEEEKALLREQIDRADNIIGYLQ